MSWIALTACIVYIIGCYVFKGNFPFYKFELYAASANRSKSAVPIFMVRQQDQWVESNIWDYHNFVDLQYSQFLSHRMPTSVTWMVEEAAQWVKEHSIDGTSTDHQEVGFGFRVLSICETSEIKEEIVIVEKGFACLKHK